MWGRSQGLMHVRIAGKNGPKLNQLDTKKISWLYLQITSLIHVSRRVRITISKLYRSTRLFLRKKWFPVWINVICMGTRSIKPCYTNPVFVHFEKFMFVFCPGDLRLVFYRICFRSLFQAKFDHENLSNLSQRNKGRIESEVPKASLENLYSLNLDSF